eukprot:5690558-Amphidinium_carterae.1
MEQCTSVLTPVVQETDADEEIDKCRVVDDGRMWTLRMEPHSECSCHKPWRSQLVRHSICHGRGTLHARIVGE